MPHSTMDLYVGMTKSKFYSSNGGNKNLNVEHPNSLPKCNVSGRMYQKGSADGNYASEEVVSSEGQVLKNNNEGLLTFPVWSSMSKSTPIDKFSNELLKEGTRFDSVKLGEGNRQASFGKDSFVERPGTILSYSSIKDELSDGRVSSPDSLSNGGSAVTGIGTLGNILGRGGIAHQMNTKCNSCNSVPSYNKTSIKATGIFNGSNASYSCSTSASTSPVNESALCQSKPNKEKLCRGNFSGIGDGGNCCTFIANGKVNASMGNVLKAGGLTDKLTGEINKKADSSSGSANLSYVGRESVMLKRALLSANSEEVKNAGNQLYKEGLFNEALRLYDRAISLSPGQPCYHSNRAAALTGLGRLAEAVLECREAIKLDPLYERAHQRAACIYLRLGYLENAKKHLTASERHADCRDVQRAQIIEKHVSRCVEARKFGDWKSVIRESDAAVVAGADSAPQIFGYKAEALLRLGRPEAADTVITAAQRVESSIMKAQLRPSTPFLLFLQAQIDMALGRFDSAIMAAESALQIDPKNVEISALLRKARAICYARSAGNRIFKEGKFFEACALYGEGLESDPTNAVLLCNRAACRSKLRQWEKAVEDCTAALSIQPNYTKALMRRANCFAKLERWEDAQRDFQILRREIPDDMEVARGLFDVQVAIKKSRGEDIYKMKFGGEVEEVSSNDHFRESVTSPGLTVAKFSTRWNDRCRQISPLIDKLCKCNPSVNFIKVDVDDNPYLAKMENISFVPTFKIYKDGIKVKEIIGPSEQALEFAVKRYSL